MTIAKERPDPYGPKRRAIVSAQTDAAPQEAGTRGGELLKSALRAMLYERPEEARATLEALATPEALAARDPFAVDALAYLSSVRWVLGDANGSMDAADQALELAPDRFAPNQKAGEMSLRLGNVDTAEGRFLAALRASQPGTADARAAESCLREARRRQSRGIRHEARAPRLGGWFSRLRPARRERTAAGPAAAEAAQLQ